MKGRKNKAGGGKLEGPSSGDKDWEADLKSRPAKFSPASKVNAEAEERKRGGKAAGKASAKNAGRMPRKSGGRAGGSNANPLSSAHAGTPAKGHSATGSRN